jgi:2-polyprenyl-6-methoxyphenol hydroxylase-like FAD-dependent oxidoreductase
MGWRKRCLVSLSVLDRLVLRLRRSYGGSGALHFRIIDRSFDRAHESRALAIQARTLEILDSLGVADVLVAHGNPSARLVIHLGGQRVPSVRQLHARARLQSY